MSLKQFDVNKGRSSWDEYFMNLTNSVASRSTCAKWRTGCVIVRDNRVVSTGYNGTVCGSTNCDDYWRSRCPSNQTFVSFLQTKRFRLEHRQYAASNEIHAEMNALLGDSVKARGCTLYTLLSPCSECAKCIAQAGISRVCYHIMKYECAAKYLRDHNVSVSYVPLGTATHMLLNGDA